MAWILHFNGSVYCVPDWEFNPKRARKSELSALFPPSLISCDDCHRGVWVGPSTPDEVIDEIVLVHNKDHVIERAQSILQGN